MERKKANAGLFPLWKGAAIAGGVCLVVYLVLMILTWVNLGGVMKIVERMNLR